MHSITVESFVVNVRKRVVQQYVQLFVYNIHEEEKILAFTSYFVFWIRVIIITCFLQCTSVFETQMFLKIFTDLKPLQLSLLVIFYMLLLFYVWKFWQLFFNRLGAKYYVLTALTNKHKVSHLTWNNHLNHITRCSIEAPSGFSICNYSLNWFQPFQLLKFPSYLPKFSM